MTQKATAIIQPDGTINPSDITPVATTTTNVYYGTSDYYPDDATDSYQPYPGAAYGAVKYTINAAGQETFYGYDQAGHTILQYVYKQWTNSSGSTVYGWVGTTSVYDSAGRLTDTYQATYLDSTGLTDSDGNHILSITDGGPAGIQVNETVFSAPLLTQRVDYNSLGQKTDTIDQYSGVTSYTYDALGNTIRTVYPNGTETLSVYDALNRAIWTTNQFDPSNLATCVLTRTVYNQLGQVVETDQYVNPSSGDLIQISTTSVGSATVSTSTIATTSDSTPIGTPTGWTLSSVTKTFYDPAGNAIETISPNAITIGTGNSETINSTGLRTGTIYYPNGKVEYTGPLSSSAPNGGDSSTGDYSTSDFLVNSSTGYTQTLYNQYNSMLGLFYTRTVDQNGHHTDTYTDALGRTIRTVYHDTSYTETLYAMGSPK